jgi:hypothetical protein
MTTEQLRLKTLGELAQASNLPTDTLLPVLIPGSATLKAAPLSEVRRSQILQVPTILSTSTLQVSGNADGVLLSLAFTPVSTQSILVVDVCINSITVNGTSNAGAVSFGWGGAAQQRLGSNICATSSSESSKGGGCAAAKLIYAANHNGLVGTRTYNIFGKSNTVSGSIQINAGGGASSLTITEILF